MIFRFIYFLAIGWWFSLFVALAGYILCISIIGLPIGLLLLNRLPTFLYLREHGASCPEGYDHRHEREELPFILRVVWFFVLGWEVGLLAIMIGYCLCISIVGAPLGIYLLNRVPFILTLSRHYD